MKLCEACRLAGLRSAIHSLAECPAQRAADSAEDIRIAIASSWFTRWASNYVSSLAALAAAGVELGREK